MKSGMQVFAGWDGAVAHDGRTHMEWALSAIKENGWTMDDVKLVKRPTELGTMILVIMR